MFKNFTSEIILTTLISSLFLLFCGGGIFLKREILSFNLGLNKCRETFSFVESQLEVIRNLKIFHDAYLRRIILGIGALTIFIIFFLYLTEETSLRMASNFSVELRWIVVPILVLSLIGFPSIEYIYKMEEGEGVDSYTFKRMGFQWFWSYENSSSLFDSYIGRDGDSDSPLYLSSSNKVTLPRFTPIINVVSSGDVIHRWALPSILMKIDAIPGRLNTLSFSLPWMENSVLYGQCSELCGVNHRFMPIVVNLRRGNL